jgi:hypothetical protein
MMWIALGIILVVVAFVVAAAIYQYVRPPRGAAVTRHELTPFEATAAAKPNNSGALAGNGPGGDWTSHDGSDWKKKTSSE